MHPGECKFDIRGNLGSWSLTPYARVNGYSRAVFVLSRTCFSHVCPWVEALDLENMTLRWGS